MTRFMSQDNVVAQLAHQLAGIPFRLFARRPFVPPQKALIIHPCCLSRVLLATPLLSLLSKSFPNAQFDWAISDAARPAIVTNPRVTSFLRTSSDSVAQATRHDLQELTRQIRDENYDTCFILGTSAKLTQIAWRAGIPQRIGLNSKGSGYANTMAVSPPKGEKNAATIYLSLAEALGLDAKDTAVKMEFYPKDADYTAVTQRLIDEMEWMGERPLAILHPGGGQGAPFEDDLRHWPMERFVLLGNHIMRKHNACLVVVGSEHDRKTAESIVGMMSDKAVSWAGKITLGELGALCGLADLYVGNDTGPTHISVAMGCATVAIYGPTDPAISAPFTQDEDNLIILQDASEERPFSWETRLKIRDVTKATDTLMNRKKQKD